MNTPNPAHTHPAMQNTPPGHGPASGTAPAHHPTPGSDRTGSLLAQALGPAWQQLHPTLQAHYAGGAVREQGAMDVEFPRWMAPLLWLLRWLGALVHRAQPQVHTMVQRHTQGPRQTWARTLTYADGQVLRFNSVWVLEDGTRLREYVNPWLALELSPQVVGNALHYEGVCFVLRLGAWRWRLSERWLLGHTLIDEHALDAQHYAMDFRLVHPWFGQVFRYAGRFAVGAGAEATGATR